MKNVLACASMMLLMAVSALAAGQVKTPSCGTCGGAPTYNNYGKWQTGQGGEFTLIIVSGTDIDLSQYSPAAKNQGTTNSFQTFCIEENEYIYPNTTSSYTINPYAMAGGVNAPVSGKDPISQGTAWLYSRFALGILKYDYANNVLTTAHPNGRYTDAAFLQQAFWYLENEIPLPATANPYLTEVTTQFGSLSAAQADANGQYGVAALNLYDPNTPFTKQQTQLVFVADSGFTAGLLGFGLAGLFVASRKFRLN